MNLIIPKKILDQHLVALGKTGAGKSSALRHMAEWLLWQGKRVCIIDPKGDWYGLKWGADGKHEGFPIIGFGDFKEPKGTDIPLNVQAGRDLAKMICGGNRPAMVGFRGWMPGEMTRFWIDFSSTLFNEINGELYLIIDEVHNFAAKGKIMDVDAGKCLHWTNRLMSEARGLGLICLIASQRPAKVHNDTLTCCETLVAMRVNHPSDREASKEWIEGCGDIAKGKEVLASLAQMSRGEAFVWSPEIGYGPERVKFPMFETFDSFAPPQLQKKVNAATWDNVALPEVKEKFSRIIEEAKANDPAELKRKVAELEQKLRKAEQKAPEVQQSEPVKVPVFDAACQQLLEGVMDACDQVFEETQKRSHDFKLILQWLEDAKKRMNELVRQPVQPAKKFSSRDIKVTPISVREAFDKASPHMVQTNGDLTGPQRAILNTVSTLGLRGLNPDVDMIARWMNLHPNGGTFRGNLAYLRREGYLDECILTEKGVQNAKPSQTGIQALKAVVDGPKQAIIEVLELEQNLDVTGLAAALGLHPNGGTFRGNLSRLRIMGVITKSGSPVRLTSQAFA